MVVILFVALSFYCIYLNLRVREIQEELTELNIDIDTLEIKVYNKMMDVRTEIKGLIKSKTVEKSRRRSTKRSRKISPTKIS
jgi:cell division protein FtsL